VDCPGYRTEQELVFRISTTSTVARKRKKAAKNAEQEAENVNYSDGSTPQSAVLELAARAHSIPLFIEIQQSWEEHSEPLVLQCFGRTTFLKQVYKSSASDETLKSVSRLFARAFMTNHFMAPDDPKELQYYLHRTLHSVRDAIQDPARCVMDSTVATVWLLGNYEVAWRP